MNMECHKLDTPSQIFFYEQDFYVFSNFSSFGLDWKEHYFQTSEAAYHWEKFPNEPAIQHEILNARSAHDALKIARENKYFQRTDWNEVKVEIMREILRAKVAQHEYIRYKLLESGNRELIEDSWRDNFWGWGLNKDGKNMLGKIWMEIRNELKELNGLK